MAPFRMITRFQSVLEATASVLLLPMIGCLVGLVAALPHDRLRRRRRGALGVNPGERDPERVTENE
jgi:hypothetical protein